MLQAIHPASPETPALPPSADPAQTEAPWALPTPLRAAASWVFLLAALAAVDAGWTFTEISRRTERDVRAVRSSGVSLIRFERRYYTQDEIVGMLRARPWRAAVPLGALSLLFVGCGVLALSRPRAGTLAAASLTLAGGALYLEVAPGITARGVVLFLFLLAVAGLGVHGALVFHRLRTRPPPATSDNQDYAGAE